jgi:hypothetical protein
MQKINSILEITFFFILTFLLFFLFFINLPLFQEPHGLLIMNQLSDFSTNEITTTTFLSSIIVCTSLGILTLKWSPAFTPGMASNLWAATFFLMWVDSMFALSIQSESFRYLKLLGLGLVFIYLFFFVLHYLSLSKDLKQEPNEKSFKYKLINYWLGTWMILYLIISIRLLFGSFGQSELQWPLAIGFCALCFLNYLLLSFLRRTTAKKDTGLFRIGKYLFGLWVLLLLLAGIDQLWFH